MKSIYKPLLFIAALFTTAACSNVDDEGLTPDTPVRIKHLTVNATSDDDETRVVIGELTNGKYPVLWENEDETLTLIEYNGSEYKTYTSTGYNTEDGKQATFTFDIEEREGSSFSYNAFSPDSAFNGVDDNCLEFTLPEVQKPCAAGEDGEYKVDPSAIILYSSNNKYEGGRQPEDCITLKFKHLTSYARMNIKNLQLDEGAKVKSIKFTVDDENSELSGECLYDGDDCIGSTNSVTLDVESLDITSSDFVVWFSTIPAKIETGFTVEVATDNKTYRRTLRMADYPENTTLNFEAGHIAKFSVNMATADEVLYYNKVTSADDLTPGQYLIVYETGNRVFDGSGKDKEGLDPANNYKEVTIENDKIESTSDLDNSSFTLAQFGNKFTIKSASGYYVYRTEDSNGMDVIDSEETAKDYLNTISIVENGDADIVSSGAHLRYYATSGQDRFRYYKSTTYTHQKAVQLYKKEGSTTAPDKIPAEIDLTVNSITIEANETSGTVRGVKIKYQFDVDVTVSEGKEWVRNAQYNEADNTVTFTATANDTTTERTAKLTITATGIEGTESATATITVTQLPNNTKTAMFDFVNDLYKHVENNENISGKVHKKNDITVVFGGSGSSTMYYNNNTAVRMYESNTLTISGSGDVKIAKIEFVWGNTTKGLTVDTGTLSNETWTSSTNTNKVVFTANNGQQHIRSINVTYTGGSDTPDAPIVTVSKDTLEWEWNDNTAQNVSVTVSDDEANVEATLNDDSHFTAEYKNGNVTVTPKSTNETTDARTATVTVTATNAGGVSEPATFTVTQKGKTEGGDTTEVTDVLNNAFTGVGNVQNYANWSKTGTSGAVYAGRSAGQYTTIQLRTKESNEGVVTTASGGKVTKIAVKWNSNTADARTLDVYAKNSAYSSAADLFNSSNQGTKVATFKKLDGNQEIAISGDYTFIGFRSSADALYLDEVKITWSSGDSETPTTPVAPTVSVSPESLTWTSDETTAKTVNVTVTGDANEITATSSNASYFTASYANGKVTVTPTSANTSTEARTATVTVKATNAGVSGEATITVTQDGKTEQGGETEIKTATISSFSALNGNIDNVISYATNAGGGTSGPYLTNNTIRLYQNSSGAAGGNITVTAKTGYKIKSVTIGSAQSTSVRYSIDNGSEHLPSTAASLNANGKYTVSDLNAASVTFHCYGKTSSTRLEVNYLSVTYEGQGDGGDGGDSGEGGEQGGGGTKTFTIKSADVVNGSSYSNYEKTVESRGWVITYGGNNSSVGTNSGSRSNCNLKSYSKYAVSGIATTSTTASAFANTTPISKVSKIECSIGGGGSNGNTKIYLLYSADNSTFTQMSGTSVQTITSTSGTVTFEFSECSGYFAVLFVAGNTSGVWRNDDVNLTFTYTE